MFLHHPCYWNQKIQAGWPSGMRSWIKELVTSMAWVRVPVPSFCWHNYTKSCFLNFWTPAHGIFYHHSSYWPLNIQAVLPSGLRRWFKAPVTSVAWVRVPILSFYWHFYTQYCFLYFEHLHTVSSTIIHAIENKTYRQDGRVVWGAGIRYQSLRWPRFDS